MVTGLLAADTCTSRSVSQCADTTRMARGSPMSLPHWRSERVKALSWIAFIGLPWPTKIAGARPLISGRSSGASGCGSCAPELRHAASKPPATAIAEPASTMRRVGEWEG